MTERATYPVHAETSTAKAKLRQLQQDKGRTHKRIGNAARRSQRLAMRAFAFTGAASITSQFNRESPAGVVDPIAEALVPLHALRQSLTDQFLGYSAKARNDARQETVAAFRTTASETGLTAGVTDFYNAARRIREQVESGRNLIRKDPRFIGPDLATVSKAALKGNLDLLWKNVAALNPFSVIGSAFDYLVEGITAE